MRRLILSIATVCLAITINAQSPEFSKAYEACVKLNDGFNDGFANVEQITSAANTLSGMKIGKPSLRWLKGEKRSLNGHLLFTPDFVNKVVKDKSVYKMADDYALRNSQRSVGRNDADVLMETLLIPAGKTYKFEMVNCTGESEIGCVAETNGLFSWKVTTETMDISKTSKVYRDNDDEKIGRVARMMTVRSDSKYKIMLEIKNTSKHDATFAIIAR